MVILFYAELPKRNVKAHCRPRQHGPAFSSLNALDAARAGKKRGTKIVMAAPRPSPKQTRKRQRKRHDSLELAALCMPATGLPGDYDRAPEFNAVARNQIDTFTYESLSSASIANHSS
jgi:hypothetical protein